MTILPLAVRQLRLAGGSDCEKHKNSAKETESGIESVNNEARSAEAGASQAVDEKRREGGKEKGGQEGRKQDEKGPGVCKGGGMKGGNTGRGRCEVT